MPIKESDEYLFGFVLELIDLKLLDSSFMLEK